MNVFKRFLKGILLRGETSDPSDNENGSVWYNSTTNKLKGYLESAIREVITADQTQTITNKTIDADSNTITNIENVDIKAAAAIDATKISTGVVSNIEFDYLDGVTSAIQTQINTKITASSADVLINKSIDADTNTITNIENADIKAAAAIDATKISTGVVSNIEFDYLDGVTSAIQTQINAKISASSFDVLTNKSIDADTNTITNIENADIKAAAAIDASKIANGLVSNIEFQYLDGVTSSIQTQLNSAIINPMDTIGDMIYGGVSGVPTKLDNGSSGTVLMSAGAAAPTWSDTFTTPKSFVVAADQTPLILQAHTTQTSPIFRAITSALADIFTVNLTNVTSTVPILSPAGTAAAPALSFSGDPDSGIYNSAINEVSISTSGANRLSVSSSALTTTSPILSPLGSAAAPSYTFTGDSDTGVYSAGANLVNFAVGGLAASEIRIVGGRKQFNFGANAIGEVGGFGMLLSQTGSPAVAFKSSDTTAGNMTSLYFIDGSDDVCGTVTSDTTANTTSYNTSSDSRLKTNVTSFDALALIGLMNPVKYERFTKPGFEEYGFLAQELYTVFPQAVTPGGDNSSTNPWQMDYSKLTGVLCKAIQELSDKNDALEARIAALETP